MAFDKVWGTDIEILAATSLFSANIYIYTKTGNNYSWHKFSKQMLDKSLPINDHFIYLYHVSWVHFDVVVDVSGPVTIDKKCKDEDTMYQHSKKVKAENIIDESLFVQQITDKTSNNTEVKQTKVVSTYSDEKLLSKTKNKRKCDIVDSNRAKRAKTEVCCSTDLLGSNIFDIVAKQNIKNFHKSIKYEIFQCTICFEAWPINTKPKLKFYICKRCSMDKETPKKFSKENFMIPSPVPRQLQDLTQIEEMLIACALPIMRVYLKPGGQHGYSGHCINMPQKLGKLAKTLPYYPKDLPLVLVTVKGEGNALKYVTVRRKHVEQALKWLIENNPQYKDLKIDTHALESLPENGMPHDLKTIELTEERVQTVQNDDHNVEDFVYNGSTETSSFVPHNENNKLESEAIKNALLNNKIDWPELDSEPLNEYSTPFLATMAFPALFPDGKGDPTNPYLLRDVSLSSRIQHLIKFADNNGSILSYRYASHPRFSYWALNMLQRKRALQQKYFS